MSRADEIGTSIGMGLSCVRHRLPDLIDNKSRPNNKMPNWWVSSHWIAPDDDDDDDDDDGDNNDKNDDNGNNDKNDDNGNNDNSNNDNNNDDSTSAATTVRSD